MCFNSSVPFFPIDTAEVYPMSKRCTRRRFLQTSTALAGALWPSLEAFGQGNPSAARPNVVLITVDDMGWTGPACYGSDLHETPHIDRLAAEGMRFTQAYAASPLCTPTRASIMSGTHPARLQMTTWHENALSRRDGPGNNPLAAPLTEPNLALRYVTPAEAARDAGYTTLHVGKWHLGDAMHYPEAQGFDANIGGVFFGAPYTYWYPYRGGRTTGGGGYEYRYVPGLHLGEEGEYLTDRLTTEAIALLDRVHDRPFFLNMCYYSPHTPMEGKPDLVAHYQARIRDGMTHRNAVYAAMVHALDENIGRLLDALDRLGVADNTVVAFVSDNGGYTRVINGEQVTSNAPLRNGKGSLYEGGVRVPLIVRWPGRVAPGTVCTEPVVSMDLYPTLIAAMGAEADPGPGQAADGLSLLPLFDNPSADLGRDSLYFHFPHYYFATKPMGAMRHGDWKLIEHFEDGRTELFNLARDLGETADVAADHPDIAEDLRRRLAAWRNEVNASMPEPNEEARS